MLRNQRKKSKINLLILFVHFRPVWRVRAHVNSMKCLIGINIKQEKSKFFSSKLLYAKNVSTVEFIGLSLLRILRWLLRLLYFSANLLPFFSIATLSLRTLRTVFISSYFTFCLEWCTHRNLNLTAWYILISFDLSLAISFVAFWAHLHVTTLCLLRARLDSQASRSSPCYIYA